MDEPSFRVAQYVFRELGQQDTYKRNFKQYFVRFENREIEMLNHIDKKNRPTMVDISSKETTKRSATATAKIIFPEAVKDRFRDGDLQTKKGPVRTH